MSDKRAPRPKASLAVCLRRVVKPRWRLRDGEDGGLEQSLANHREVEGLGLAVLCTIPGSYFHDRAAWMPLCLLVENDGHVVEGGVSLDGIYRNTRCLPSRLRRFHRSDPLRDPLEAAVEAWAKANRDRWWIEHGRGETWRETTKLIIGSINDGYSERRVALAERATARAEDRKRAHELEVDALMGSAT